MESKLKLLFIFIFSFFFLFFLFFLFFFFFFFFIFPFTSTNDFFCLPNDGKNATQVTVTATDSSGARIVCEFIVLVMRPEGRFQGAWLDFCCRNKRGSGAPSSQKKKKKKKEGKRREEKKRKGKREELRQRKGMMFCVTVPCLFNNIHI